MTPIRGLHEPSMAGSGNAGSGLATPAGWTPASVPTVLIVAVIALWFATQAYHFREMARIWFEGGDMAHGPLVPLVAGYMAWLRRHELAKAAIRPTRWGLALVVWGAFQSSLSLLADWRFPGFITFWISLVGCILYLYGYPVLRLLLYPLVVLLMMTPPPTFLYDRLTLALQFVSSALAEKGLDAMGVSVLREGNILELLGERLSVAEACSGIRALIAVTFFCSIYVFFYVSNPSLRIVLWLAAVPIAILGNTLRILLTAMAGQYNRAFIHGTVHEVTGYVSVLIAGLLCVGLHRASERLWSRWKPSAGQLAGGKGSPA